MTFAVTVSPVSAVDSVGTVPVTLTGCTAGRAIVGGLTWNLDGTTVASVSATGESNATLVGSAAESTGSNGTQIGQLFYFPNLASGGSKTVTVTFSGTPPDGTIWAMEVSGGNTSLPDTNASWHLEVGATVASGSPSGSITTNTANALIVTQVIGGQLDDPAPPTGYTGVALTPTDFRQGAAYLLDAGTAGSETVTWTIGTSDQYSLNIAAFRLVGGLSVAARTANLFRRRRLA